jgi:hypothetical protein
MVGRPLPGGGGRGPPRRPGHFAPWWPGAAVLANRSRPAEGGDPCAARCGWGWPLCRTDQQSVLRPWPIRWRGPVTAQGRLRDDSAARHANRLFKEQRHAGRGGGYCLVAAAVRCSLAPQSLLPRDGALRKGQIGPSLRPRRAAQIIRASVVADGTRDGVSSVGAGRARRGTATSTCGNEAVSGHEIWTLSDTDADRPISARRAAGAHLPSLPLYGFPSGVRQ